MRSYNPPQIGHDGTNPRGRTMIGDITLTAENEVEGRLVRLNQVIGYVCALGDADGNSRVLDKVAGLHDHKGDLLVIWKQQPTSAEMRYFSVAWMSNVGDGADNVKHEMATP